MYRALRYFCDSYQSNKHQRYCIDPPQRAAIVRKYGLRDLG